MTRLIDIRRSALFGLLAVILLGFAVGCGSDDDDNGGGNEQTPGPGQVLIQGFNYTPNPSTIPVGTTVIWTNRDTVPHTVTAGAPGNESGAFDSGSIAPGATFTHTFEAAGTFPYFCKLHPNMRASVVVQ